MMKTKVPNSMRQLIVGLVLASSLFAHGGIADTQAPTEDGLWYYEIGGADPVSVPANPEVTSITLGGSVQLGLGYSCGALIRSRRSRIA